MTQMNTVFAIDMASLDATKINAITWSSLTPATGLPQPCFLIRIINNSASDIEVSFDGVTPHDYIPGDTVLPLYLQSNAVMTNIVALLPRGTKICVRGAAAASGDIYLAGYYHRQ